MADEAPPVRPARYGAGTLTIADDGASLTCHIAGEIDLANSGDVFAAIAGAVTAEHETVVLDVRETTYIDSAGLALLVEINGRLHTRRTRLVIAAGETTPARRLLAISGLDKVLDVVA